MKAMKTAFQVNGKQKKAGVTILTTTKQSKLKVIKRDQEGHLYNDKGVNPSRIYNNYKYLCAHILKPYSAAGLSDIDDTEIFL